MYVCLMKEDSEEERANDDKESLIPASLPPAPEDTTPAPPLPLLLMFTHQGKADNEKMPTRRGIEIGCIKSNLVKKPTGDFSIDNHGSANPFAKCFNFDVMKVRSLGYLRQW